MVLYKAAIFIGLLAVAATTLSIRILPPGAVSCSSIQTPRNVFSMLIHYGSAKLGYLRTTGQVGDGREAYVLKYVQEHVPPGDAEPVLRTIDELAWSGTFLMNVGPNKGLILDDVLQKQKPCIALEIGAYVGYSAVRIGSQLRPGCKLYSLEKNVENAEVARGMLKHAGLDGVVEVITGILETSATVSLR
jgi:hypothetical protein